MAERNLYADTNSSSHITTRHHEALRHLQMLGISSLSADVGIMEIGSGMGAVTRALRILSPASPFLAIDSDTRIEVSQAARDNQTNFIQRDVNGITAKELEDYIQTHNIRQIIGLRIPAVVAENIITKLAEIGFEGQFAFSVIVLPQEIDSLRRLAVRTNREQRRTFAESRLMTEYGYSIPFPLAQSENVA